MTSPFETNSASPSGCSVELSDILSRSDSDRSPLFCGNCDEDLVAMSRCKDCDELLCLSCVSAHARLKLTKEHTVIDLSTNRQFRQDLSPSVSRSSGSPRSGLLSHCEKHLGDSVESYCDNCGVIFCLGCSLAQHSGHNTVLLSEALECARNSNLKLFNETKINALAIKECIELTQRMQESVNCRSVIVTREIKNMMHRFHMAIEEREAELLERLKMIVKQKSKGIHNQIQTFKTLYSCFIQASKELNDVLESGTPLDMIQVRDSVSAELRRLRSMRNCMVHVDDTIQIVPPDWSMLMAISTMGDISGYCENVTEQTSVIGEELVKSVSKNSVFYNNIEDYSNFKENLPPPPLQENRIQRNNNNNNNRGHVLIKAPRARNYVARDYSKAGAPSMILGSEGEENGKFCRPWGVCCNSEGHILVADRSNNRVQIFKPDGTFIFKFGSHGSAPGYFDRPAGITTDNRERIIVADKDNHRIQIFTAKGLFVSTFGEKGTKVGQFNYPWDVAADPQGRIVVSDSRNHRIQLFDSEGIFIAKYGFEVTPNGIKHFDSPRGVCFGSNGYVIVTDFNNHRLVVIDPNFRHGRFIGCEGSGEAQFSRPQGIAIDSAGNIIVADSRNNRIQILEKSGNFIGQFGTSGKEPGEMDRPSGLCLAPNGKIIVVDFGNNRVQVF